MSKNESRKKKPKSEIGYMKNNFYVMIDLIYFGFNRLFLLFLLFLIFFGSLVNARELSGVWEYDLEMMVTFEGNKFSDKTIEWYSCIPTRLFFDGVHIVSVVTVKQCENDKRAFFEKNRTTPELVKYEVMYGDSETVVIRKIGKDHESVEVFRFLNDDSFWVYSPDEHARYFFKRLVGKDKDSAVQELESILDK